jgi:hypothetical protein
MYTSESRYTAALNDNSITRAGPINIVNSSLTPWLSRSFLYLLAGLWNGKGPVTYSRTI